MPVLVPGLAPLARVPIAEGTFQMGSTLFQDAQPVTEVTVSDFDVTETKVTIREYQDYLRAIGDNRITLAVESPETGDITIVGRGRTPQEVLEAYDASLSSRLSSGMSPGARVALGGFMLFEVVDPVIPERWRQTLDQPVVEVDWWEMLSFAAAHGGDLPTEAEYERIQRGRSGTDNCGTQTGSLRIIEDEDRRKKLAHFMKPCTASVRTYPPNSWGVFDASGLIWNWTQTRYTPSYQGLERQDPKGPRHGDFRVKRGGGHDNDMASMHAAFRGFSSPTQRNESTGGVVIWAGHTTQTHYVAIPTAG